MNKVDLRTCSRREVLLSSIAFVSTSTIPLLAQGYEDLLECITEKPADLATFGSQSAQDSIIASLEENEAAPKFAEMGPQGVAHASFRWRPSDGLQAPPGKIRLGVAFAGNPENSWKREVQMRASRWVTQGTRLSSKIELVFVDEVDKAQIVVGKAGRGGLPIANKSFIGRLALNGRLEDGISTMVIHNVSSTEHEFGHALCLGHEHKHEALPVKIDPEKAIAYYERRHGWSRQKTIDNVLNSGERCAGDLAFNPKSCMLYPLNPEILVEQNFEYFRYSAIHERDRKCLDEIYGV